ncbi:tetratricopeptide repeat-containing sensor histidine kinase [Pedobacter westerhofensis]|nr:tetratricopeptide repeat-containing sensor histidine kinase [Pedobacter westerhofensis]
MAFQHRDNGMPDSAFFYFNKAKDIFLQHHDNLGTAKCLLNMAIIATDRGDNFGSQEMSLNALRYFDQKDADQFIYICSNYNNLGRATQNLLDYKRAIKFYELAIEFSRDSSTILINQNNKANVLNAMKSYKEAIVLYSSILKTTRNNNREYARVLTNISYTKWLQNFSYDARPDYLKALKIRIADNDLFGQNSSYSHLAQYFAKKDPDSAMMFARKHLQVAKILNSPDDQLSALQELVTLSPASETKSYFERYRILDDSLQVARWKAKNQFALIRFETEKHKADFQKSQAENAEKKNRILIGYFIVVALVLSLLSVYLWFRKRNRLLRQEKELEVKNTELKYVKKIHDRVANKVYHLMSEVENIPNLKRDLLLDKLEALYNTSRDISYENKEPTSEGNYAAQLSGMLQSYSSASTEVLIVGNDEEVWIGINDTAKDELFIVMQELMTNMKRHSQAQMVVIKFLRDDYCITVLYTDNGIGMADAGRNNGLKNTENRINGIHGTITFESILEKGLDITISFPIA